MDILCIIHFLFNYMSPLNRLLGCLLLIHRSNPQDIINRLQDPPQNKNLGHKELERLIEVHNNCLLGKCCMNLHSLNCKYLVNIHWVEWYLEYKNILLDNSNIKTPRPQTTNLQHK